MGNKNDGKSLSRAFLRRQQEEKVRQEIEQEKGEVRRQRKIGHGARVGLGVAVIGVLIATPIIMSAMAGEENKPEPTVTEATEVVANGSETVVSEYNTDGILMAEDGQSYGGGAGASCYNLSDAQRVGFQIYVEQVDENTYELSEKDQELRENPPTCWVEAIERGIIPGDVAFNYRFAGQEFAVVPYSENYVIVLVNGYVQCVNMREGIQVDEAKRRGLIPDGDYNNKYYFFPKHYDSSKGFERYIVVANGYMREITNPSEGQDEHPSEKSEEDSAGTPVDMGNNPINKPTTWQDAVSQGVIPQGDYSTGCYVFPYSQDLAIVIINDYMEYQSIDDGIATDHEVEVLHDLQQQGLIPEGDYSEGYYIFPCAQDDSFITYCVVIINGRIAEYWDEPAKFVSLGNFEVGAGQITAPADAVSQGFLPVSSDDLTYVDDAPRQNDVNPLNDQDEEVGSEEIVPSETSDDMSYMSKGKLPAQEITVSDAQVYVKQSVNVGARLTKGDGKLTYASSDTNIATVDANGRVLAGDKSGAVTITIKASQTTSFAETEKQITVTILDKAQPTITVTPYVNLVVDEAWLPDTKVEGGKASKLTYASSNTAVAQMIAGQVVAVGAGTADISVTLPESTTTRETTVIVKVTVTKVQPTITISNNIRLMTGKKTAVAANAKVKNGSASNLRLTSSSPSVASIVNNCIVAGNPGTATVTFTLPETNKAKMATRKVTVTVSKGQATLTLPSTAMTLSVNQKSAANAGATVTGADDSDIMLTSSNPNVARIDASKRILAVSPGTAIVTVRVPDTTSATGARRTVQVTVGKLSNTMSVSRAKRTASASTLKSKAVTVTPLSVKNAKGSVSYGKVSGSSCLTVNTKTGKVTVKKGTKKGTYTANVRIRANGNSSYKSKAITTNVTVVVK